MLIANSFPCLVFITNHKMMSQLWLAENVRRLKYLYVILKTQLSSEINGAENEVHDPKDGGGRVKQEPEPRKHMCRVGMDAHLSDEDGVLERQTF